MPPIALKVIPLEKLPIDPVGTISETGDVQLSKDLPAGDAFVFIFSDLWGQLTPKDVASVREQIRKLVPDKKIVVLALGPETTSQV